VIIEAIASSSFALWLVALAIVLIDSILLLAPGEFAFCFRRDGRPDLRIPRTPFVMRNRDLVVTSVSFFARPFFVASVNLPQGANGVRLEDLRDIARRSRWLSVYCCVACVAIVAGPVLTAYFGIGLALLCTAPVLYLNALCAAIFLVANRKSLAGALRSVPLVCFELAVCPILAVNLYKHVIDRDRIFDAREMIEADEQLEQRLQTNLENFDEARG
jgi:hypothetical protein